ncbi:MAG: Fe-Mn family superoxide dismutase [Myxococcota bacterium]|nr:Fe-Mn family superoxide dismutase [Myxococcota bacterium]
MTIELPALPYAQNALEPHISANTLSFHYGKHHAGYVKKLNAAIEKDSSLQGKSLEELVTGTTGGVFNNAAQVWNHTFYWNSMSPNGGGAPTGALAAAIDAAFGSFEDFKAAFGAAAGGQFGSGWAWLVKNASGNLEIVATSNAASPLTEGLTPILTCDVWEHAYYLDYQNGRGNYVSALWSLVNWEFAAANFA